MENEVEDGDGQDRIFPGRLTNGGFLTIGYSLRTIDYCFPHCFLEIFVGGQGLDGGEKSRDGGSLQSSH